VPEPDDVWITALATYADAGSGRPKARAWHDRLVIRDIIIDPRAVTQYLLIRRS